MLWVQDTLRHAGLVANEAKCAWVPSHRVQWLCFIIDLSVGCISVPVQKITALRSIMRSAVGQHVLSAKLAWWAR